MQSVCEVPANDIARHPDNLTLREYDLFCTYLKNILLLYVLLTGMQSLAKVDIDILNRHT